MKKIKGNFTVVSFALIVVIAFAVRFYHIGGNPNGLQVDEASIAFDAYLVASTGQDEKGVVWPLYPQSSWNPKHPVYFYASMVSVSLFGLNETAARIPSVFFGLLAVTGAFLLARELFGDDRIALMSALLLAVSPWHVHFSRFAIEAVALPAVFTFGLLLIIKGLKGSGVALIPGAAVTGLCFYTYPVSLVFVPLFLIGASFLYLKEIRGRAGWVSAAFVILILMYLPVLLFFFPDTGMNRYLADASINSKTARTHIAEYLAGHDDAVHRFLSTNVLTITAYGFAANYIGYLSPRFLFLRGDNTSITHNPGPFGMMHAVCMLFLAAGLCAIFLKRDKPHLLLLWWLLVFPVGAAMTNWGGQHAIRSIVVLPGLQMICAIGFCAIIDLVKKKNGGRLRGTIAAVAMIAALAVNCFVYYEYYFNVYPEKSSAYFNYGFRDAFRLMANARGEYNKLIVSDAVPYIYTYLFFYVPPTPEQISRDEKTGAVDIEATARNIGFEICDIRNCMETADPSGLVLARPMHLPEGIYKKKRADGYFRLQKIKTYSYNAGTPSISVARIDTLVTPRKTIRALPGSGE